MWHGAEWAARFDGVVGVSMRQRRLLDLTGLWGGAWG